MAKVENDFTEALLVFFTTTTDLDHLVAFVPWLHKMAKSTVEKSVEIMKEKGWPSEVFGSATASSVINVLHDGEYITRAPAGKRVSAGQDVDRMADEIAGRMNASILTVLHESWETYLKRAYGKLLFYLKDEFSPPNRSSFHEATPTWRKYRNTQQYFHDYANWCCRIDCSEALRAFHSELAFDQVHVRHWRSMEWPAVAKVLAFSRHCIVHNDGRVSDARWRKLNKAQATFIRSMMRKSILSDEERILPPAKSVDALIEAIMSYAYGIYVLLSKRCGLAVDHTLFKSVRET